MRKLKKRDDVAIQCAGGIYNKTNKEIHRRGIAANDLSQSVNLNITYVVK
jgi:hypothetical protein